MFQSNLTFVM